MGKNIRGPIALVLSLIVLLICLYAIAGFYAMGGEDHEPEANDHSTLSRQPPITTADTIKARQKTPFQFLVSYTDRGFEPKEVSIGEGQTVRFTNNSSGRLWVAAVGDALYPSIQNGCGSSALDSCKALGVGEYWQFTAHVSGTWSYANTLKKDATGVIVVRTP